MRFLLLILLCLPAMVFAQQRDSVKLNLLDKKGQKNGLWYTQMPERMGEDSYSELGTYVHGLKWGRWYRFGNEGDMVAEENYKNNVLDGEVKYFENGRLTSIGHYLGLNPAHKYDTVLVVDPATGNESYVPILSARGALRHGNWKFYDPETGRLVREEEYQADDLIGQKSFELTPTDSTYFRARIERMPHNQKRVYRLPSGKGSSQIK